MRRFSFFFFISSIFSVAVADQIDPIFMSPLDSMEALKEVDSLSLHEAIFAPSHGFDSIHLTSSDRFWIDENKQALLQVVLQQCIHLKRYSLHRKALRYLIEEAKVDLAAINAQGQTALHELLTDLFIQPWHFGTIVNLFYVWNRAGFDLRKTKNHFGWSIEDVIDLRIQDAVSFLEWQLWVDIKNFIYKM